MEKNLGKRTSKKELPRSPAFRGATLGEFWMYFIGRFFMAGAFSSRLRLGRSGWHVFIPAAPRARRISARLVMVSQIGDSPLCALSPQGCQLRCHYQSDFVPAIIQRVVVPVTMTKPIAVRYICLNALNSAIARKRDMP